jgi:hypothetical protein
MNFITDLLTNEKLYLGKLEPMVVRKALDILEWMQATPGPEDEDAK